MSRHVEHWVWAASETTRELRASFARPGLARNVAAGISTALVALPLNILLQLLTGPDVLGGQCRHGGALGTSKAHP